jgi:CheY-like chemotaxis protein
MTKLLLVEDDPTLRSILRRQLEPRGYVTQSVASGEEALEVSTRETPEVILLDVNLPGINGFETLARLQQTPATAEIPVILLTVKDGTDDLMRGYKAGCVYYIPKPFSLEELLRGLEIALA